MNKAYLVVGLNYGDEGKGSIVDFLTPEFNANTIVRFNGGSQAAHNVKYKGKAHCFSQFGSGTFHSNVKTYLSSFMYVDPLSLMVEEEVLRANLVTDAYERLFVDEDCCVITPFQKNIGRMREFLLQNGSCGMGVGETVRDSKVLGNKQLKIKDFKDKQILEEKLDFLYRVKLDQAEQLLQKSPDSQAMQNYFKISNRKDLISDLTKKYQEFAQKINIVKDYDLKGTVIFEGAQGALLDSQHGFYPFTTKTDCTFKNAEKLISNFDQVQRIGVLRGYSTRHGKGPFITEDNSLTNISIYEDNKYHTWQKKFRVGWFDLVASHYALEVVGGVDSLALTHLDCLENINPIKMCTVYGIKSDLSPEYFEFKKKSNKNIIKEIKKNSNFSNKKRQEITNTLMNVKPIYKEFKDLESYLQFLKSEQGLNTPIKIQSYGPTNKDKITSL